MQVILETPSINLSASRHVRLIRKVGLILGRSLARAKAVSVYVSHESGDGGKRQAYCEVMIALPRLKVIARHRASSILAAVIFAASKANRSLERYLHKRARPSSGSPAQLAFALERAA